MILLMDSPDPLALCPVCGHSVLRFEFPDGSVVLEDPSQGEWRLARYWLGSEYLDRHPRVPGCPAVPRAHACPGPPPPPPLGFYELVLLVAPLSTGPIGWDGGRL